MSKFTSNYLINMDDIVREGDPALRKVTEEVPLPLTDEDKETLQSMMLFLKNSQDPEISVRLGLRAGVGLSANQIGLDKRMFVMYFTDAKGELYEHTLINPKIISHSTSMLYLPQGEGCLSVDREIRGYVPRYERVKVKAYDLTGAEVNLRFKGFPAIVFQHEMDHLNGVMFYDRINTGNPFKLPENTDIKSV